jgi:hypothetical protein
VTVAPPVLTGLTPPTLSLPRGTAGSLTVTLSPTQPDPTVVPLQSSDPTVAEVPGSVTVPAGAEQGSFPVLAREEGSSTVTAGPSPAPPRPPPSPSPPRPW